MSSCHCQGKTKTGRRCRAAATEGGLCFFHANPNKASELGRIGGRSKRHAVVESRDPPRLDNAIAVRDMVAQLIADVYAGKIQPRVAASLAPLLNLHLRAIETSNLELRVKKLEKRLAELEADGENKATVGRPTPLDGGGQNVRWVSHQGICLS